MVDEEPEAPHADPAPPEPEPARDVNTALPLAINVVAIVSCWGGPLVLVIGAIGVVFAVQAFRARRDGDLEPARAKAKTSLILGVIALGLGAVSAVVLALRAR